MLEVTWQIIGALFGVLFLVLCVYIPIRDGIVSFRNRNKTHYDEEMQMQVSSRDDRSERQAIGASIVLIFLISIVVIIYT